ncbi:MAG TPA: hypothetical protein VLJ21_01855 [Candidatus Binatia bacterium]|nr:hypothetical protein [Candidatus Binatia bacterium]
MNLLRTLGLAAALALPSTVHSQPRQDVTAEQVKLEGKIHDAVIKELKKRFPEVPANIIKLEPLLIDANSYGNYFRGAMESAADVAGAYYKDVENGWYGIITVDGLDFVGQFRLDKDDQFVRSLQSIDASEKEFIRAIRNFKDVTPPVKRGALPSSSDPYKALIEKAQTAPTVGKHITPELLKAIETGNGKNLLLGLGTQATPTELALACTFIPVMNTPNYAFTHTDLGKGTVDKYADIRLISPDVFREDISVAAQVLASYSWAREFAENDWSNYLRGVVNPRASTEYNGGGRTKLFKAVKAFLKNTRSLEDAITKIANVTSKLVQPEVPCTADSPTWLSVIARAGDRPEGRAILGAQLLRVAGIPAYEARTPWWADASGNSAWTWVPMENAQKFYSFLAGEPGKTDIHGYDLKNAMHGVPHLAKAYANGLDITDKCTPTARVQFTLGAACGNKDVGLAVFNYGMWQVVAHAKSSAAGIVAFEKVGCIGDREGLVFAPFCNNTLAGLPVVVAQGINKPITPYEFKERPLIALPDFKPGKEYDVWAYGKDGWLPLKLTKTDDQGVLQVPFEENTYFWPRDAKLVEVNDILKGQFPVSRPFVVRKTKDGYDARRH